MNSVTEEATETEIKTESESNDGEISYDSDNQNSETYSLYQWQHELKKEDCNSNFTSNLAFVKNEFERVDVVQKAFEAEGVVEILGTHKAQGVIEVLGPHKAQGTVEQGSDNQNTDKVQRVYIINGITTNNITDAENKINLGLNSENGSFGSTSNLSIAAFSVQPQKNTKLNRSSVTTNVIQNTDYDVSSTVVLDTVKQNLTANSFTIKEEIVISDEDITLTHEFEPPPKVAHLPEKSHKRLEKWKEIPLTTKRKVNQTTNTKDMPVNRHRTTAKVTWTEEDIQSAKTAVERGLPIRRAAIQYNIPSSTLRDRLKNKNMSIPRLGRKPFFIKQQETKIAEQVKLLVDPSKAKAKPVPLDDETLLIHNSMRYISSGINEPFSKWNFIWRHIYPEEPIADRMEDFVLQIGPTYNFQHPYSAFATIWDREIMEHIVYHTNLHAEISGPSFENDEDTKTLSVDELYVYFAIVLSMPMVIKTDTRDYWKQCGTPIDTPNFCKHMSMKRFFHISKILHFSKNDPSLLTMSDHEFKLFKLQPVINHLNRKFQELYALDRNIVMAENSIDTEADVRSKKNDSIQMYELCDGKTGYLWRFKLYVNEISTKPFHPNSYSLVSEMLEGLEYRGHCVFISDYYTSPALVRHLKSLGFDVVGPLNMKRQFIPSALDVMKEKLKVGEICGMTSGDIDIVLWRDGEELVTLISTYHSIHGALKISLNEKPVILSDYNASTAGMDKKDRVLAAFPIEKNCTWAAFWCKRMFKRFLNASVYNAYILLKPTATMTHRTFREELIKGLLDQHSNKPNESVKIQKERYYFSETHLQHYPSFFDDTSLTDINENKTKCTSCDKYTRTYCPGCKVALCLKTCFLSYHTSPS